jgi:anti-sigma B factor antagonist
MQISIKEKDEIKIVKIEGKLDTNTAPDAEKQVKKLLEEGNNKIIINFENLDYISSAGLRLLLATAKQLKSDNGDMRVCNLNDVVEEIFDISGFVSILNVFNSEAEALDNF